MEEKLKMEKEVLTSEKLMLFANRVVEVFKDHCPNGSLEFKDLYGELDINNLTLQFKATIVFPLKDLAKLYGYGSDEH